MTAVRSRRAEYSLIYRSARSQITNTSIEDEQENYLQIGGLLYTFVSMKDLPDGTFPGILRELLVLDFPIIVNAEVTIPDQTKILDHFKGRLRRMQAAQRDSHGGFKINVEAQVAQSQLQEVLQAVISSSLKVCNYSLVIAVRTSKPIVSRADLEEAQRTLNDRRQRVVHAVTRMNGARAIPESLAQRRLFIGSLPGMAQENKRDVSCLTLHGADLLPIEMPWQGTPQSPLMLLETPYRQLIPFSPYDPSMGDANMLFLAKSGGGKTFMAQMFLLMMARANPLISIIERGDSYRPLVELMGGRVIEVDLEGSETLNPWDLPPGEIQPTKDKIAFLKNLTRHMIGDLGQSDTSLLDNILSEAIGKVYKRVAVRADNKTPTYMDLRSELSTWTDEERLEHIRQLAQLAAVALRQWTGEKGVYSKLFDRHTTIRTDANWLFFNIEGLSADSRLETAMSMLIAQAMSERASGKSGQPSITVLDECWSLLESPVLADCVVQLFRTARKRGASVWGISQTLEDFVGTKQKPKEHGSGILRNASVKVIGQQPGDVSPLVEHLALNEVALSEIKRFLRTAKGEECGSPAGPGREVGDHADDPAGADAARLLGRDDVSARAGVPHLLPGFRRQSPSGRSSTAIGSWGSGFLTDWQTWTSCPRRPRAPSSRRAPGVGRSTTRQWGWEAVYENSSAHRGGIAIRDKPAGRDKGCGHWISGLLILGMVVPTAGRRSTRSLRWTDGPFQHREPSGEQCPQLYPKHHAAAAGGDTVGIGGVARVPEPIAKSLGAGRLANLGDQSRERPRPAVDRDVSRSAEQPLLHRREQRTASESDAAGRHHAESPGQ